MLEEWQEKEIERSRRNKKFDKNNRFVCLECGKTFKRKSTFDVRCQCGGVDVELE